MTDDPRLTTGDETPDDVDIDRALRPNSIEAFVGQESARQKLSIFLKAAQQRHEALDHVLLAGPPAAGDRRPVDRSGSRSGRCLRSSHQASAHRT